MYTHCDECNGTTYHIQTVVERKDGMKFNATECEACETLHIEVK